MTMKLKPLTDIPDRWCPVCDAQRNDRLAIEVHNLRCSRFGERAYHKALRVTLALLLAAGLGYAEAWERDFRLWEAGIVATCPKVTTIVHHGTPWEKANGRTPRTEHLTISPECAG